jgi:hypothetical protein
MGVFLWWESVLFYIILGVQFLASGIGWEIAYRFKNSGWRFISIAFLLMGIRRSIHFIHFEYRVHFMEFLDNVLLPGVVSFLLAIGVVKLLTFSKSCECDV